MCASVVSISKDLEEAILQYWYLSNNSVVQSQKAVTEYLQDQ